MKNSLKIYVASSWRNTYQPAVVEALRSEGHDVYDFRNPGPGNNGFRWTEIDPKWENWTAEQYAEALEHPIAKEAFHLDLGAVISADLCVLVLPSGRSASWEYGFHCGMSGRAGIVHMPEKCQPELMYSGSAFTETLPELLVAVDAYAAKMLRNAGIEAYCDMLMDVKDAVAHDTEASETFMKILNRSTVDIDALVTSLEGLRLVKDEPEPAK